MDVQKIIKDSRRTPSTPTVVTGDVIHGDVQPPAPQPQPPVDDQVREDESANK